MLCVFMDCVSALKNVGIPKLNDLPCEADSQFVCEFDASINYGVETFTQIDQSKFLKPLTNYGKKAY